MYKCFGTQYYNYSYFRQACQRSHEAYDQIYTLLHKHTVLCHVIRLSNI